MANRYVKPAAFKLNFPSNFLLKFNDVQVGLQKFTSALGQLFCVFLQTLLDKLKVIDFNTQKGWYVFEFNGLETDLHSHPAIEIIYASKGCFSCSTKHTVYTDMTFAIIDSNLMHRLSAIDSTIEMVMIEGNDQLTKTIAAGNNISLVAGLYGQHKDHHHTCFINQLREHILAQPSKTDYDPRVASIINFIDTHQLEYVGMMKALQQVVFLSESRLSHLFKEKVGISLKKYLLWNKLKTTINQHLTTKEDLFGLLIKAGFYDQPHFSKAFKTMLGVKPSKVYNSRTLQVLPQKPL